MFVLFRQSHQLICFAWSNWKEFNTTVAPRNSTAHGIQVVGGGAAYSFTITGGSVTTFTATIGEVDVIGRSSGNVLGTFSFSTPTQVHSFTISAPEECVGVDLVFYQTL